MGIRSLDKKLTAFLRDQSGEFNLQLMVFVGAFALLAALVAAPALDKASKSYAEHRALGIDTVITGSINKSDKQNRRVVRKSVLDQN